MPLVPGSRFGAYEIVSALGVGGMGEVYRGRDAKLHRDVAIKVLREELAADSSLLARLAREAQVLASLNHPHIAAIYGVEENAGRQALVLELVEGETLADRIARGPVPLEEALAIARQIADALRTAHEQRIVHRDLKPGNVKLRHDGVVKVLDFGLAKTVAPPGAAAASFSSPTLTAAALTEAGLIVGTPAYMAPEQATGKAADKRSDVWAFGCVLYEMLTGRRAFAGVDVAETLAAVLAHDPDWSLLPAGVSPSIRALLRRCLTRDPRGRLGDLAAVQFVLEEQAALASPSLTATMQRPPRGRWSTSGVIGSMLVAGVLAALVVWLLTRTPPPRVMRLGLVTAASVAPSFEQTNDVSVGIAPNGSWIAYVGNRSTQLFLRPLDSNAPKAIVTTQGQLRGVFVSDDGQWIGYVENDDTLRKVPSSGGSPNTIATMEGAVSRGAAWSTKRGIVFATDDSTATGLQHVHPSGGPITVLTKPDAERGERDHVFPQFLPDDRHVLFTILPASGGLDGSQVAVLDLESGAWKTVFQGGHNGRFAPSGHLLYVVGRALWAVAFDPSRLEARGAPVEVAPHLVTGPSGAAGFNVARDGTLAYLDAPAGLTTERSLVWVGRSGREEAVLDVPRGSYITPRISPDGARLAVSEAGDLWLVNLAVTSPTRDRVTFGPEVEWYPVWTPDGRRLVFGSRRGTGAVSNLYVQSVVGGAADRLTQSPYFHFPTSITPDGAAVVFHGAGASFPSLQRVQLDPPHALDTLLDTPYSEANAEFSPDGRWLAYEGGHASRPGQKDVYVRPFPDVDTGQRQVSSLGGIQPVWARDGEELFYRELDGSVMAARVAIDGASFSTQKPIRLFRGPYVTRSPDGGRTYDVSPDGRFLMIKEESDPELPPPHIVVVLHAGEELERLAP